MAKDMREAMERQARLHREARRGVDDFAWGMITGGAITTAVVVGTVLILRAAGG